MSISGSGAYIFCTEPPSGFIDIQGAVYNSIGYMRLHRLPDHTFLAIDPDKKQICIRISLFREGTLVCSPLKAPFGSFEVRKGIPEDVFHDFTGWVLKQLAEMGLTDLRIRSFPECYDPDAFAMIDGALGYLGSEKYPTEPNHHLQIEEGGFMAGLHAMEKRKLDKCVKAGMDFRHLPAAMIRTVFAFTETCREERGYALSMTLDEIEKGIRQLPGTYQLFGLYHESKLIAASVCVKVSNRVLYNFYPASLLEYNLYSPMVCLLSGIFDWCHGVGFQILDLGTSWTGTAPNESLIGFKERMGGIPGERVTYHLRLA